MALEQLRLTVAQMRVATWAFDAEGIIHRAGGELIEFLGWTQKELIGLSVLREDADPTFREMATRALRGEEIHETTIYRSRVLQVIMVPVLDAKCLLSGVNATATDATPLIEATDAKDQAIEETRRSQKLIISKLVTFSRYWEEETTEHIIRVSATVKALALGDGVNEEDAETIATASMMHDVGKIAVPRDLLLARRSLSPEEFALVRTHARKGYDILNHIPESEVLEVAATIAHAHHEDWDGKGYPLGLREAAIPQPARYTRIADTWDALTSDRPYRDGMAREKALEVMASLRGKAFDPETLDLFLTVC